MGLGQYVYPRFAVHVATGQSVPIERLRAHCLWHPATGMNGLMVSGHVLYISQALNDAMEVALGVSDAAEAEVDVENGEEGIAHRLAAPVQAFRFAAIQKMVYNIADKVRQALPVTKRKLLAKLPQDLAPEVLLVHMEKLLYQEGLHVLVPLSVGKSYQLFTDATEALLPVSPLVLGRGPRLCFVLLSTDDLIDKREGSPWLRQAAELMVLPVNALRTPEVLGFLADLPPLRAVLQDEPLLGELATTLHEVTGGWPDLCDRFYSTLLKLADVDALRERMRRLLTLLRTAQDGPGPADELLSLALGSAHPDVPDLPEGIKPGDKPRGGHHRHALLATLRSPQPFTWDEHGRGYLDGTLGWDRGMAVPRSQVLAAVLRERLPSETDARPTPAGPSGTGSTGVTGPGPTVGSGSGPTAARGTDPSPHTVRWLHVSDFHFAQKTGAESDIVLRSLLATVQDFRDKGRAVDLIFVTGDIANSGAESEYLMAEDYLAKLCATAGVPRSALHMVPGNHDVYRPHGEGLARTMDDAEAAARYFQPGAHRHHLVKLEAFRAFYNRFYAGEPTPRSAAPRSAEVGQATAGPEQVRVRDLTIGVLPLNTAWFAQDDSDSGKLLVGESAVRGGLAALSGATLRLAYMHHPISDLHAIERQLVGERLAAGCHVLLRGHLHEAQAHSVSSGDHQHIMLAAGAAYQGRHRYQNRAFYVEVDVDREARRGPTQPRDSEAVGTAVAAVIDAPKAGTGPGTVRRAHVHPYPIRYELTGHDRWTLDTSVFPLRYPTYLQSFDLELT